jgi:hypothetical protein
MPVSTVSNEVVVKAYLQAYYDRRDLVWVAEQIGLSQSSTQDRVKNMRIAGLDLPLLSRMKADPNVIKPAEIVRLRVVMEQFKKDRLMEVNERIKNRHK